jgi:2-oxoglutarate dehydrogenase E1 component
MYEKVKNMKPVFEKYCQKLIDQGVISEAEVKEAKNQLLHKYEEAYKNALNNTVKNKWQPGDWEEHYPIKPCKEVKTGVSKQLLQELFPHLSTWPSDFNVHQTIQKIYEERKTNFQNNQGLDMATMESLAFATLLKEGYGIRLSGQDVERGTFSHRHALLSDQKNDRPKHFFLKSISPNVDICNSHLSEFGVLGFEYGYSITNLNSLVIWEAQFGDFANGAQIIIDNFIVSAETKWEQSSGIVLNLPHGMDGQGPEHSSGRIERFLEMSDDNTEVDLTTTYQEQL